MKKWVKITSIGAGIFASCMFGAWLWSFNYTLAYLVKLHSAQMLKLFTSGDLLQPYRQAVAYADDPCIASITRLAALATAAEPVAFGLAAWIAIKRPFMAKPPKGGAKLATKSDLRLANLLSGVRGRSLLLGSFDGQDVRYSGDSHIYVNGPTRTGKGRGFVMTNLLEWEGSAIIVDPKKENWNLTAAARMALGQKVYLFSPGSRDSHRWNPLDFIRPWPERATDLMNMSVSLIPIGEKETATIWKETARGLAASLFGYVLESRMMEGRRHVRSVLRMLSTGAAFSTIIHKILKEEPELNEFILDGLRQHLARDGEQQMSFEGNVTTGLGPWKNTLIAAATSGSDFDLSKLRSEPFSVFMASPVSDLGSVEPLLRLFIEQTHDVMLRKLPDPHSEPHKVLILVDEFFQFQKLPEIITRAPLVAGFGMQIVIVVQNVTQLDDRYDKTAREAFTGNMDVRLIVAAGDDTTAEWVSKNIGRQYVEREGWSQSGAGLIGRRSSSGRYEFLPIMDPESVKSLDDSRVLLSVRGHNTAILTKLNFYVDRRFVEKRAAIAKRGFKLPEPRLGELVDWPLFSKPPADLPSNGQRPVEADPGKKPMSDRYSDELTDAVIQHSHAVYTNPDRLCNLIRVALLAVDSGPTTEILQNLRTNPGRYGELVILNDRRSLGRLLGRGQQKADASISIQKLRAAISAARRTVIDQRARLFAAHQWDLERLVAERSKGQGEVTAVPATVTAVELEEPRPTIGGRAQAAVLPDELDVRDEYDVDDDFDQIDVNTVSASMNEIREMHSLVEITERSEEATSSVPDPSQVERMRAAYRAVRSSISEGLAEAPSVLSQ